MDQAAATRAGSEDLKTTDWGPTCNSSGRTYEAYGHARSQLRQWFPDRSMSVMHAHVCLHIHTHVQVRLFMMQMRAYIYAHAYVHMRTVVMQAEQRQGDEVRRHGSRGLPEEGPSHPPSIVAVCECST